MIYSYAGVWYYDALDRTCVYYENKCAVIIHGNARETQMHFWSRHPYAHVQVFTIIYIYIYVHIFMVTIEGTKLQPYFVCHELFIVLGYPLSHTCNMFFLQCRSKSSQPWSYQTKILGTLAYRAILLLFIQLLVIIQPSIQPNHHLEPHRGWLFMGDPGDGVPNHLWRVIGENGLLVRQEVLWCFSMLSKRDHLKGETVMLYHIFNQNHISAWWSGSIPNIGYKMAIWMGKMVIKHDSEPFKWWWMVE